ncbi:hypothetical protein ACIP6I_37175 [Streptomyces anulatus]
MATQAAGPRFSTPAAYRRVEASDRCAVPTRRVASTKLIRA